VWEITSTNFYFCIFGGECKGKTCRGYKDLVSLLKKKKKLTDWYFRVKEKKITRVKYKRKGGKTRRRRRRR
jgi:hypothetical protein